jgi:hypothetical protein
MNSVIAIADEPSGRATPRDRLTVCSILSSSSVSATIDRKMRQTKLIQVPRQRTHWRSAICGLVYTRWPGAVMTHFKADGRIRALISCPVSCAHSIIHTRDESQVFVESSQYGSAMPHSRIRPLRSYSDNECRFVEVEKYRIVCSTFSVVFHGITAP